MLILGPKMSSFGHDENFSQNMGFVTFLCFVNRNFMLKIRKSNKLILSKGAIDGQTDGKTGRQTDEQMDWKKKLNS